MAREKIKIKSSILAPLEKVWQYWTSPEHIMQWNTAAPDWHTPNVVNDVRAKGEFSWRMEARDGSAGFDFEEVYDEVLENKSITYTISDGRKVEINFRQEGESTCVEENFEADVFHSPEFQQQGWQAILNNFKLYVERREFTFKDEPLD